MTIQDRIELQKDADIIKLTDGLSIAQQCIEELLHKEPMVYEGDLQEIITNLVTVREMLWEAYNDKQES